jgi:hypothetical protein
LAQEAGGLAVAPHPYDLFRAGIRESVLDALPLDGLEVCERTRLEPPRPPFVEPKVLPRQVRHLMTGALR